MPRIGLIVASLVLAAGVAAPPGTARAACAAPGSACGLQLGGTNAYVTFGDPAALDLATFTIETWFRRDGTGTTTSTGTGGLAAFVPLVTKGAGQADGSNVDANYLLGISAAGNVIAADFEEGAGGASPGLNHPVSGVTPIVNGVWYHAAATYDGSTWRLYLNGVLENQLVVGQPVRADSIQRAGLGTTLTSTGTASGFFNGVLDEARVWSGARSAAQIQATLNAQNPADPALVARWGLDEGGGTSVGDSTSPAENGTITGSNWSWSDGAPFNASQPPEVPVLHSPPDAGTGVSLSPTLAVDVDDPDADPLTVTFYGRDASSVGEDFTIAVLPDTQYYSCGAPCGASPATFQAQTQWIVTNRAALNIAYVGHLGDCVEHGNSGNGVDPDPDYEWLNASAAMALLENPITTGLPDGLPFGVPPGNHDQTPNGDPVGSPAENSTDSFNRFFGAARFAGRDYYGGHYGTNNDNHYALFSAGGMDFIVIDFEYDPTPDAPVLAWANALLQANPTRRAIAITHNMLGTGNPGAFSAQGQAIYDALKGNPNLFLLLGGHVPGEGRRQDTFSGNTVHSLLADFQSRTNGGNGWMRLLRFSPSTNQIHVQTYSPTLNQYEIDADSDFTLAYDMGGAGFTVIGTNSGVGSPDTTSIAWPGRDPATTYDWYATVSDGASTVTSDVWSFTTGACGNGVVDAGEDCDGAAPPDDACCTPACQFAAAGVACAADGSVCTLDACDGAGACSHPAGNAGTPCRAPAGLCDAAEQCDGVSPTCPADAKSTAVCRAAAGVCDVAEACDGVGNSCPADAKSTAECRAAAGVCDVAEVCDGVGNACPADAKSTAPCRAAVGVCDVAEACDGVGNACPADAKSTAECRAAVGVCDVAEACDGVGNACPADAKSTAPCRAAAGACDVAEACDGVGDACPADAKSTAECRAAAGVCDVAEACDGVGNTCPADAKSTAECRAAAGVCDVAEACDGVGNTCPADGAQVDGTACGDGQFCNGAETCAGGVCEGAAAPCVGACDEGGDVCVGNCPLAPQLSCRGAGRALLYVKDAADDGKDKLLWKWSRGTATSQGEFGDPTQTAAYSLCLYAAGALVAEARVEAGSGWAALGDKGYKYQDAARSQSGVGKILLKGSAEATAKALLKGQGSGLPTLAVSIPLPEPVTVQLLNTDSSLCWGESFSGPLILKNADGQLKAKK